MEATVTIRERCIGFLPGGTCGATYDLLAAAVAALNDADYLDISVRMPAYTFTLEATSADERRWRYRFVVTGGAILPSQTLSGARGYAQLIVRLVVDPDLEVVELPEAVLIISAAGEPLELRIPEQIAPPEAHQIWEWKGDKTYTIEITSVTGTGTVSYRNLASDVAGTMYIQELLTSYQPQRLPWTEDIPG